MADRPKRARLFRDIVALLYKSDWVWEVYFLCLKNDIETKPSDIEKWYSGYVDIPDKMFTVLGYKLAFLRDELSASLSQTK